MLNPVVKHVQRTEALSHGAANLEPNATPILWHLKVSHYNETARWALDYDADSETCLQSLRALVDLEASVLLSGHGYPVAGPPTSY